MRLWALFAALAVFFCTCTCGPRPSLKAPIVVLPPEASSVYRITIVCSDDTYVMGTAWAISSTEAITARHVIEWCQRNKTEPKFFLASDSVGNLHTIKLDMLARDGTDAVRLIADPPFTTWLNVRNLRPTENEELCLLAGDGYEKTLIHRCGKPVFYTQDWIALSIKVIGGNSGGPLLTLDARVVGIVKGSVQLGGTIYLMMVPSDMWSDLVPSSSPTPLPSIPDGIPP